MNGNQPDDGAPASPCTKVCKIDPATGWCLGCLRTGAEIGAWPGMTAPQKHILLATLHNRRGRLPRRTAE
jgi:predicted Fe-S protein YdhL (DUF1289 family)